MNDEAAQRVQDAEENRKAYQAVMKIGSEFGVPFALGLTMFFTSLVMANGFLPSLIYGGLVYVATFLIVKMFFSH